MQRPEFIPIEIWEAPHKPVNLNKYFMVDRNKAATFISSIKDSGRIKAHYDPSEIKLKTNYFGEVIEIKR